MTFIQIVILSFVQGFAEMLPVSSSAHVILAQKLMGLDPSSPEMTFLLVMLHTGTMGAACVYFARKWRARFFSTAGRGDFLKQILIATLMTGVMGLGLKEIIEKIILERLLGQSRGEVESLFNQLPLIGIALLVAGFFILYSSGKERNNRDVNHAPTSRQSIWVGLAQGLCLPFRGLSRSGTTLSTGLILDMPRALSEEFSFALAVALTPPVVFLELHRLMKSLKNPAQLGSGDFSWLKALTPGLEGMVFSFFAGLIALKLLSATLERGRWKYFGFYCIAFAAVVLTQAFKG